MNLNIVPWILYKYFLCALTYSKIDTYDVTHNSRTFAHIIFFSQFSRSFFFWLVIEKFQINEDRQFSNYVMYFTRNFNRILNPKY